MEILKNGYSKDIEVIVKNNGKESFSIANILTYKNNEIQILLNGLDEQNERILSNADIDIIVTFNFSNINQDFFSLLLLIYGIKKYQPKTLNLILPYFPYTNKDLYSEINSNSKTLKINTDYSLLTILYNSGITSIKTYDLGNTLLNNYSPLLIDNILKADIFKDEFNFFLNTRKRIDIIVLNINDFKYIKRILGHKKNIDIILVEENISELSKEEKITLLKRIKNGNNLGVIYIFDKMLIRGNKFYSLITLLSKNLEIKELNLCITHGVFAYGSYNRFNNLISKYPYINIITTNSVIGYAENLNKDNLTIYDLSILNKQNKIDDIEDLNNSEGNEEFILD